MAASVELKDGMHFIRARQVIRKALAQEGLARSIDKLVEQLLKAR